MVLQEVSKMWRATSMQCLELKVKVASLNCTRHSSGSQWSCLMSAVEENGGRERWPEHTGLAEDGLYASKQYHIRWKSSDPGAIKQVPMQQKQPWHYQRMNGFDRTHLFYLAHIKQ